jgi:hypothetical protein
MTMIASGSVIITVDPITSKVRIVSVDSGQCARSHSAKSSASNA